MLISTKGRYALRMMVDIAMNCGDGYVTLKDISARQDISVKYLEQVAALLCRAGLLQSLRGSSGGYRLAKAPQAYTAGDILRAAEGTLAPIACLQTESNACVRCAECTTISFWEGFYRTIETYVDGITLQDLLLQAREKEQA